MKKWHLSHFEIHNLKQRCLIENCYKLVIEAILHIFFLLDGILKTLIILSFSYYAIDHSSHSILFSLANRWIVWKHVLLTEQLGPLRTDWDKADFSQGGEVRKRPDFSMTDDLRSWYRRFDEKNCSTWILGKAVSWPWKTNQK